MRIRIYIAFLLALIATPTIAQTITPYYFIAPLRSDYVDPGDSPFIDGSQVGVATTNFGNNLSTCDSAQECFDAVDNLTLGGGGGGGLSTVATDATIDGDGSTGNPLGIADDGVTQAKLANNSVHAAQIAANAVDSSEIASDAVGTNELEADAVTEAKIADSAVGHDQLASNSVREPEIQANAVGHSEMADDSVGVDELITSNTPATSQVLGYDGSDMTWVVQSGGGGGTPVTASRDSIYLDTTDKAQASFLSGAFDEAIVDGSVLEFVLFNGGATGERRGYATMTSNEFLLLEVQATEPTDVSAAQGFLVRQTDLSGTSTSPANVLDTLFVWRGATDSDFYYRTGRSGDFRLQVYKFVAGGPTGATGADGAPGTDGTDGTDGMDGADGTGTTFSIHALDAETTIAGGDSIAFSDASDSNTEKRITRHNFGTALAATGHRTQRSTGQLRT